MKITLNLPKSIGRYSVFIIPILLTSQVIFFMSVVLPSIFPPDIGMNVPKNYKIYSNNFFKIAFDSTTWEATELNLDDSTKYANLMITPLNSDLFISLELNRQEDTEINNLLKEQQCEDLKNLYEEDYKVLEDVNFYGSEKVRLNGKEGCILKADFSVKPIEFQSISYLVFDSKENFTYVLSISFAKDEGNKNQLNSLIEDAQNFVKTFEIK